MIGIAKGRVLVGIVDQGTPKVAHYVRCVERAGGLPQVIDWRNGCDPERDAVAFDALVLCGGDDIAGRHFGQPDHPSITREDERRELYELELCRRVLEVEVPVLAICRGLQVLNVAAGGDIDQHLPDVPGRADHTGGVRHALRLDESSWMSRLAGAGDDERLRVNSFHHQAVGRVASYLRATAWTDDGAVEAVEGPGAFCVGVQWHPEREGNDEPYGQGLFDALIAAARGTL
jgi:putative glutamine amidotransferase